MFQFWQLHKAPQTFYNKCKEAAGWAERREAEVGKFVQIAKTQPRASGVIERTFVAAGGAKGKQN